MSSRTVWRGVTVDTRTAAMLTELATISGTIYINPTQGSYSGSVSASAGTHDGCGAVDLMHPSWTVTDYNLVVRHARQVGFAAWHRTPQQSNWPRHCHLIAVQPGGKTDRGCLSSGAHSQVVDYYEGRNGLASRAADDGPRTWVGVTWETYQKTNQPQEAPLKRIDYKPYNKATGKANRKIKRGKWQKIATGLKSGGKGTQNLMQGQFLLRPTVPGAYVRFVRVSGSKRDGTGDAWFPASASKNLPMSHQHIVAGGDHTWDLEIKVPGSGEATVAYTYAKSFN